MRNVMVDIETLGSRPGSIILSIGAVEFSNEAVGGRIFFRRISIGSSILAGFTMDESTVKWWTEQSREAQDKSFYCPGGAYVGAALRDFAAYVSSDKDTLVWAKGPDFDCVLLEAAYQKCGLHKPWHYRNTRDVRTIFGLAQYKPAAKATVEHDPVEDAIEQAKGVVEAANKLGVTL